MAELELKVVERCASTPVIPPGGGTYNDQIFFDVVIGMH